MLILPSTTPESIPALSSLASLASAKDQWEGTLGNAAARCLIGSHPTKIVSAIGALWLDCGGRLLGEERLEACAGTYSIWLKISGQEIRKTSLNPQGSKAILLDHASTKSRSLTSMLQASRL
jgi:hypothetical protein